MSFEKRRLSRTTLGRFLKQLLWWCLLVLVLASTLLIWVDAGSAFFGYSTGVGYGTSMEPALHDGDALWVKYLNPTEVKVGDIVTLQLPNKEPITHRVVRIYRTSNGSYSLETRGDANQFSERWEIAAEEKVAVVLIRVCFIGYVLDFLSDIVVRVLLIGAIATLAVIWVRRQRTAHRDE